MCANEELPIVAYSARGDARDALVLPDGVKEIDENLPLGCSSARRRIQLAKLFPQLGNSLRSSLVAKYDSCWIAWRHAHYEEHYESDSKQDRYHHQQSLQDVLPHYV